MYGCIIGHVHQDPVDIDIGIDIDIDRDRDV